MNIRKAFFAIGAMIFGIGLFGAFPQQAHATGGLGTQTELHAGVNCTTWVNPPNNFYPSDDSHYWVCVSAANPTLNFGRADSIANKVIGWKTSHNAVWSRLSNATAPTRYYYFQTRSDANAFMAIAFPGDALLQSNTARCGNTGTANFKTLIVSIIYETCEYGGTLGSGQNPSLTKVVSHESGHAFDFALAIANGTSGPSQSAGFKRLASSATAPKGDIQALEPANWGSLNDGQKASVVCNIFGAQLFPSLLERSLTVPNDAVCSNSSTVNAPYKTGTTPKSPVAIAAIRAPYFTLQGAVSGTAPAYEDLFAEHFSNFNGINGTGTPLAVTDRILVTNTNFTCTDWVVRMYVFTGGPPPLTGADSLGNHGCLNNPGSLN